MIRCYPLWLPTVLELQGWPGQKGAEMVQKDRAEQNANEVIPMIELRGPVEDSLKGGSHRAF